MTSQDQNHCTIKNRAFLPQCTGKWKPSCPKYMYTMTLLFTENSFTLKQFLAWSSGENNSLLIKSQTFYLPYLAQIIHRTGVKESGKNRHLENTLTAKFWFFLIFFFTHHNYSQDARIFVETLSTELWHVDISRHVKICCDAIFVKFLQRHSIWVGKDRLIRANP